MGVKKKGGVKKLGVKKTGSKKVAVKKSVGKKVGVKKSAGKNQILVKFQPEKNIVISEILLKCMFFFNYTCPSIRHPSIHRQHNRPTW